LKKLVIMNPLLSPILRLIMKNVPFLIQRSVMGAPKNTARVRILRCDITHHLSIVPQ
jgi:hypothetical protein